MYSNSGGRPLQKCAIGRGAVGCGSITLPFCWCYVAPKNRNVEKIGERALWSPVAAAKTLQGKSRGRGAAVGCVEDEGVMNFSKDKGVVTVPGNPVWGRNPPVACRA